MSKRRRKSYTEAQRQKVLTAATTEGLTALDVQKRFGVTPVTYYSWRKKRGITGPRGRKPKASVLPGGSSLTAQVRSGVQAKVRELLPAIVREEVSGYLDHVLGTGRKLK